MDAVQWVAGNAEKVGIITLLFGALIALYRGWLVTGPEHRRMLASKDQELTRVIEGCRMEREMNQRLLAQLERTVSVTETVIQRRGTNKGG